MVETGQAPHYTEIAAELGMSPREGRAALHKLFSKRGFPGWLYPNSDTIVSFAPFNNLPTPYRLNIDGHQKWFGQWAFESLAVGWLFPGKTVRIDSVCLDCGEPIRVDVRDGKIEVEDPQGLIGYVSVPIGRWMFNVPYSWSTMNFFRSEEHLRRWEGFQDKRKGGIISLNSLMWLFSSDYFKNRRRPDYVSHMSEYLAAMLTMLDRLENAGAHWRMSPLEKFGFSLALKLGLM
jgi:hypothetical protein